MATPVRKGGRNQPRARKGQGNINVSEMSRPEHGMVSPAGSRSAGEIPRTAPRLPAPGTTTVQKVGEVLKRIAPFCDMIKHTRLQFVATTRSAYWLIRREMDTWPSIVDADGMARAYLAGLSTNTAESSHAHMPEGSLTATQALILQAHCTGKLREVPLWEELIRFYPNMTMHDAIRIEMMFTTAMEDMDMDGNFVNLVASDVGNHQAFAGRQVWTNRLPDSEIDGVPVTGAYVSFDCRIFSGLVPGSDFKIKSGVTIYYGAVIRDSTDLHHERGMAVTGYIQIVSATLATPRGETIVSYNN